MLERKRKVGLIRKYFINCSVDLSRCLKSLHQPIQNKIHHISIKGHPFPQIPAVTAHSAATHFPRSSRLGTFILESSPSHPHQLQLFNFPQSIPWSIPFSASTASFQFSSHNSILPSSVCAPQDPLIWYTTLTVAFLFQNHKGPCFCLINSSRTRRVYTRKDILCRVTSHLSSLICSLVNTKPLRIYDSLSHQRCAVFSRIQTETLYMSCALTSTQGACASALGSGVDYHEPLEHLWDLVLQIKEERSRETPAAVLMLWAEFNLSHRACFLRG